MKCKCKLTSTTPYLAPNRGKSDLYLEFVKGIYYDYDVIEEYGFVSYFVNISSISVSFSSYMFNSLFDDTSKIREYNLDIILNF